MAWGEAASEEAAVEQLVRLIGNHSGYRYYRQGWVPKSKDPALLDEKLNKKYGFELEHDERHRRRSAGLANVTYIRVGHWFIILATPPYGEHPFFYAETKKGRALSKVSEPITVGSYVVKRVRKGSSLEHCVHVRLTKKVHAGLAAKFTHHALTWPKGRLEEAFAELDFLPYEPVKGQIIEVFDAANRIRTKEKKRCELDTRCLRFGVVPALPLKSAA